MFHPSSPRVVNSIKSPCVKAKICFLELDHIEGLNLPMACEVYFSTHVTKQKLLTCNS